MTDPIWPGSEWLFKECDTCATKPGTPTLCSGCIHNRDVITRIEPFVVSEREIAIDRVIAFIESTRRKKADDLGELAIWHKDTWKRTLEEAKNL